jgi:enoyl-CoA hydratase/carnithine racemase
VRASAERCPLAAATLVQILRLGRTLDVHERLVAESLAYSTLQAGPEFAAWLAARGGAPRRDTGERPPVRSRREGARLRLTLDRPHKRNAFSSEMRDALAEGLTLALADLSIEEVVLDGEGPSFCSGGDLDEFGSFPDPATAHAVRSARSPARLLSLCAERARAEVHGACVGAGCELPAFCRSVRAREDAYFQLPEVGMGLVPGAGGTASLPSRIGRQRTAWLALSGSRIDAATALRWGLVDEIAG